MVPILHMAELGCRDVIYVPKDIASGREWGLELRSDAKDMTPVIAVHRHLSNASADQAHQDACVFQTFKSHPEDRYDPREH